MASWLSTLERLAPEVFNERVASHLRAPPHVDLFSDDFRWLRHAVKCTGGPDIEEVCAHVRDAITVEAGFTHLRAYHGCRPQSLDSYRQDGIVPLNAERAQHEFREIFSIANFPELSAADLDTAIANARIENRQDRVFFEANRAHLLGSCAHYLLYGSEYILTLANDLGRRYATRLKQLGTPTLLTCDVPLSWMNRDIQLGLAGNLALAYFERARDVDFDHVNVSRGLFGFEIFRALPPDHIVAASHPTGLRDPRH
jgi:hypothetical protein